MSGAVPSLPTRGDAVLTNLRLVDGVAAEPRDGLAIVIRDGLIDAIVSGSDVDGAVIDLGGAFVMPGLINMHTHFSLSLPGAGGDAVSALDAHELALHMADGARRTLLSGVTTVRCVAEKSGADFALRRAIEAGQVPGPRIFTAGKALCCTGGHGHDTDDTLECDGADAFARGVRSQVKAGADLIKLMISAESRVRTSRSRPRSSRETRWPRPSRQPTRGVARSLRTPDRRRSSPRQWSWAWTAWSTGTN